MRIISASLLVLAAVVVPLAASTQGVLFRYPIVDPDGKLINDGMVVGVDHDPEDTGGLGYDCTNYDGLEDFPFCYDQHKGTDYILIGGFETMDAGSAVIVAAADGKVTKVDDTHYDRCHVDISTGSVTCDGFPIVGNGIYIEHEGGYVTKYWHIMQDSALVQEGDVVECGDPLALIGSAGMSTSPHLHFELTGPDGEPIDPYAGSVSQPESYWVQQEGAYGVPGAYCASALEDDADGDTVPDFMDNCPDDPNPDQLDGDDDGVGTVCDEDELEPDVVEATVEPEVIEPETIEPEVVAPEVAEEIAPAGDDALEPEVSSSGEVSTDQGDAADVDDLADGGSKHVAATIACSVSPSSRHEGSGAGVLLFLLAVIVLLGGVRRLASRGGATRRASAR